MIDFRRKQIKKLQADDRGKGLWIGENKSSVCVPCAEHDAGIGTRLPKNRVNGATDSGSGCGVSPGFRALRHGLQRRSTCLRLAILFVTFSCRSKKKLNHTGGGFGTLLFHHSATHNGPPSPSSEYVQIFHIVQGKALELFSFGKKND